MNVPTISRRRLLGFAAASPFAATALRLSAPLQQEPRPPWSWLIFDVGQNMNIRGACEEDAGALTEIAFAAKRHWRYPENWLREWQEVLTITPEYILENPTFVAAVEGEIVGFGAVQVEGCEAVLDHLWVLPQFMGRGIGRALFQRAEEIARASGAVRMRIVGDPRNRTR